MSAALFGNEKVAEVVLALDGRTAPCTAQELSMQLGIAYSMVRDVLRRLTVAGVLAALPKTGGTRSPQYYERGDNGVWLYLAATCRWASTTNVGRT